MLYLKNVNLEDKEKEYAFVSEVPEDENGFINEKDIIPEDEIYLRVNKDNPASLRVMQKNGGYIHHEDESKYYVRIAKKDI